MQRWRFPDTSVTSSFTSPPTILDAFLAPLRKFTISGTDGIIRHDLRFSPKEPNKKSGFWGRYIGLWVNRGDMFFNTWKKKHARWFKPWPFDSPVGGHDSPFKWSRFHHPKKVTIAELPRGWVPYVAKNMGHQSGSSQVQKNKGQVGTLESMQFEGSFDFHGFMSKIRAWLPGIFIYMNGWFFMAFM